MVNEIKHLDNLATDISKEGIMDKREKLEMIKKTDLGKNRIYICPYQRLLKLLF